MRACTNKGSEALSRFMPDSNCLVALFAAWHEHHDRTVREIDRRLDAGEALVLAARTLVETYAVLTRLSAPRS